MTLLAGKDFKSYPSVPQTSDMTSEGLGEMFEGDSADMCDGKFPLMLMSGRTESLACADPGTRTPIGMSGNSNTTLSKEICY
jgi:hypothetical protein